MAGKYYEELQVGDVFRHEPGRTVTETDNAHHDDHEPAAAAP